MTIVTGADFTHGASLLQFLKSACRFEPTSRIIAFDLGLRDDQLSAISKLPCPVEVRPFLFGEYPEWMNIRVAAGEYAWKPTIIGMVIQECDGPLLWMDAGDVITCKLNRTYAEIARRGFFSPSSSGDLAKWTHEKTLEFFGCDKSWAQGLRNVNAACVGFDPRHKKAMQLAKAWFAGARDKNVIAPEGSSRSNHRQDQALLGVLAHLQGMAGGATSFRGEIRTHCDVDQADLAAGQ
ncbi:hypothetical protein [Pleomorphomonas sp. PLEO]|uniref:hypothetical protein n=1 Tax=Pleomorphomonas sp. PLEO TaxID=3239306 RepID=UPI00351DDE72